MIEDYINSFNFIVIISINIILQYLNYYYCYYLEKEFILSGEHHNL